jgi:hypothetical protein
MTPKGLPPMIPARSETTAPKPANPTGIFQFIIACPREKA